VITKTKCDLNTADNEVFCELHWWTYSQANLRVSKIRVQV